MARIRTQLFRHTAAVRGSRDPRLRAQAFRHGGKSARKGVRKAVHKGVPKGVRKAVRKNLRKLCFFLRVFIKRFLNVLPYPKLFEETVILYINTCRYFSNFGIGHTTLLLSAVV